MMKRFVFFPVAAALLMLASCGPQAFVLPVELRQGSASGMDLGGGKTLSIIYLTDADTTVQAGQAVLAEKLARRLENDYFGGNHEAVDIYCLDREEGTDYTAKETLIDLVVRTGDDVVFLLQRPSEPDGYQLSVIDSMSGSDEVRSFAGKASAIGKQFAPNWKEYLFELYSMEFSNNFEDAAQYASAMRWDDAMKLWMEEASSHNAYRRSCAAYNLAVGCTVKGDRKLALKWLDKSDAVYKLPASGALRSLLTSK